MATLTSPVTTVNKAAENYTLGWKPMTGDVASYNLYVSLTSSVAGLTVIMQNINPHPAEIPTGRGRVTASVAIGAVRTALGLSADVDFTNIILYYAITTVDSAGSESALANSTISEILPVGIEPSQRKDDPTQYRQIFGFSDSSYRWVKAAVSSKGGLITDAADFYKANITTEYTYDGTNLAETKSYPSDKTSAGMPAKLTTYEYSGSDLIKVTVTDSTI